MSTSGGKKPRATAKPPPQAPKTPRIQRSPRLESRFQARIVGVNGGRTPVDAGLHTRDLSLEGMKLLFSENCPLNQGDEVEGELRLTPTTGSPFAGSEIELVVHFTATVIWKRTRECGLQYLPMAKADRRLYGRLLESLLNLSLA